MGLPDTQKSPEVPSHTNSTVGMSRPADEPLSMEEVLVKVEKALHKDTIWPPHSMKHLVCEHTQDRQLTQVAKELIQANIKTVGLIACSPSNVSHLPATELDGIAGTAALVKLFLKMQKRVLVISDAINHEVLHEVLSTYPGIKEYYSTTEIEIGLVPPPLGDERVQLRTFVPPLGWDDEWESALASVYKAVDYLISIKRVGKASCGKYFNPRGMTMHHYCADLDRLFDWARRDKKTTTCIGDVGNELGMGNLASIVEEKVANGKRIANHFKADHVLVSHTSSWAAYGLCATIAVILASTKQTQPAKGTAPHEALVAGGGDAGQAEQPSMFLDLFVNDEDEVILNDVLKEKDVWDYSTGKERHCGGLDDDNHWELKMKFRKFAALGGLAPFPEAFGVQA